MGTDVQKIIAAGINKFGVDTVYKGADISASDLGFISTGSFAFDWALGCPGLPVGRVTEIFGYEGGGKSSLSLHMIGNTQKEGGIAIYIETEHCWDPAWAKSFGVDPENLILCQPSTLEEACKAVEFFVDEAFKITQGDKPIIVVWDSVAGTPAQAELDGDVGDHHVGVHARLLSLEFRRLTQMLAKKSVALVLVNQLKEHINAGWSPPGANAHALQKMGGRSINFHASLQIRVTRRAMIKETQQGDPIGINVNVNIVKNKIGLPYRKADLRLIFGKGFDDEMSIFPFMKQAGIVTGGAGGWYQFPTVFGTQNVRESNIIEALQANENLMEAVKKMLLQPQSLQKFDEAFTEKPSEAESFQCGDCDGVVPGDATVCPHCGASFEEEEGGEDTGKEEGQETPAPEPAPAEPAPAPEPAPEPEPAAATAPDADETTTPEPAPAEPEAPPLEQFPQVGFCAECSEPQYETDSGRTCKNGHGGAETLSQPRADLEEAEAAAEPTPEPTAPTPEPAPATEEEMFECSECHGDVPMSANICPHCQAEFTDDEEESETKPPEEETPPASATEQALPQMDPDAVFD